MHEQDEREAASMGFYSRELLTKVKFQGERRERNPGQHPAAAWPMQGEALGGMASSFRVLPQQSAVAV